MRFVNCFKCLTTHFNRLLQINLLTLLILCLDVPGPITGEATVSDSGKNWVSLTWGKPEYRGAAPVLAYRVEAWRLGSEGGAQWAEVRLFIYFNLDTKL